MKLFAASLTLLLAGCASHHSYEWADLEPGCYEKRGLYEARDYMGLTDIRIARLHDTGQDPGLMVHFRRQIKGIFGQDKGQPDLLLAVGDRQRSCVIVLQQSACPQAEAIYTALTSATIPVGYAFNDPTGITLLHGTTYFLSSRDGQGNQIDWRYYGPDHPLQQTLSNALDNLAVCAKPAATAFNGAGL